jgi:hypothetical protein
MTETRVGTKERTGSLLLSRAYRAGAILGLLRENIVLLRFEDGRLANHRRLLRDCLFDALDAMNPEEIFVSSRGPLMDDACCAGGQEKIMASTGAAIRGNVGSNRWVILTVPCMGVEYFYKGDDSTRSAPLRNCFEDFGWLAYS